MCCYQDERQQRVEEKCTEGSILFELPRPLKLPPYKLSHLRELFPSIDSWSGGEAKLHVRTAGFAEC